MCFYHEGARRYATRRSKCIHSPQRGPRGLFTTVICTPDTKVPWSSTKGSSQSCKIHNPDLPHVRCPCVVGFRQCRRQGARQSLHLKNNQNWLPTTPHHRCFSHGCDAED